VKLIKSKLIFSEFIDVSMELPNAKLFKNEELIILNYSISSLYSTPPMIAKFELKEQSLKIA
jgi:hypothetical protein